MHALCRAHISRNHLAHNLSIIKRFAGHRHVLAMIKADAYGHGLTIVAKALPDVDGFGVARLEEAIALRSAGISQTIVVMSGFQTAEQLAAMAKLQLDCVVHELAQLTLLQSQASTYQGRVWIKVDTGMTRLGLSPSDLPLVQQSLYAMGVDDSRWVFMTHLACADETYSAVTQSQLTMFDGVVDNKNCVTSVCNSAALMRGVAMDSQWVRPGLMLYGISPFPQKTASDFDLLPVMTLRASVVAVKKIPAGQGVGYGHAWVSDRSTTVALVGIGYGDGYVRHTMSGVNVSINNQLVSTVGRVSMDLLAVDVGDHQVAVGDDVTLWGDDLPVETIAQQCHRSVYEMLCGITTRVERVID